MGYKNVWEITIRTREGVTAVRYVGKSSLVEPYVDWLRYLVYVTDVTSRKLSNEERKQIPFDMIIA